MDVRICGNVVRCLGASLLALVVGCGCGGGRHSAQRPGNVSADQPDAQEAAAAYVADLAPYLTRADGRCETDETRSRFVAYFEGGEVRYLIEQTDPGEYGSTVSVNEYFFDAGRLFHYRENRRAVVHDAGYPATTAIEVRLSFDASGALSRTSKTIDGAPAAVSDDEVMSVRRHVEHLRLAARDVHFRGRRTARR